MNELTKIGAAPQGVIPFAFEGKPVRVEMNAEGEPLFVARDVVEAVGAVWKGHDSIKHVPEQWRGVQSVWIEGQNQQVRVLAEQGVYFYLNRSDKPKALPIQMWLAGEVLPSIRKTTAVHRPSGRRPASERSSVRGKRAIRVSCQQAR